MNQITDKISKKFITLLINWTTMQFRKGTKKDFNALREIWREFYYWECERDPELKKDYAIKGIPTQLSKDLRNKDVSFFIAKDTGVIGFARATIEDSPAYLKHDRTGHITNLYVKENFRGKGIGKSLLKECFKFFEKRKITNSKIMVNSYNKKAEKLYKRLGFREQIKTLTKP